MKNIKLHVSKATITSAICVACGRFQADLVFILADGSPAEYGLHKKCAPLVHVKRTRKVVASAAE